MPQKPQEDLDPNEDDSSWSNDKVRAGLLLLEVFSSVVQLVTFFSIHAESLRYLPFEHTAIALLASLLAALVVHIISCSVLACLLWRQRRKRKWKTAFLLGISQILDVFIDIAFALFGFSIAMPRVTSIGLLASSLWLSFVLMTTAVSLFSSIYVLRTSPFLPNVCLRFYGGCSRNRVFGAQIKDHIVNFFLVTIVAMQILSLALNDSLGHPIWKIATIYYNSTAFAQCPGITCRPGKYILGDLDCERPDERFDGPGDSIWRTYPFLELLFSDEDYDGVSSLLQNALQDSNRVCLTWAKMGKFDDSGARVMNVTQFLVIFGMIVFLALSIFVSEAYRPKARSVIRFGKGVMLLAALLLEIIQIDVPLREKRAFTATSEEGYVVFRRESHLPTGPDLQVLGVVGVFFGYSTIAFSSLAVLFCDFTGPNRSKKSAVKDNSPGATSASSDHPIDDLHIERREINLA